MKRRDRVRSVRRDERTLSSRRDAGLIAAKESSEYHSKTGNATRSIGSGVEHIQGEASLCLRPGDRGYARRAGSLAAWGGDNRIRCCIDVEVLDFRREVKGVYYFGMVM